MGVLRWLAAVVLAVGGTTACSVVKDGGQQEKPIDDPGACEVKAGPKTLHRLNRTEYNNTVRDLLGVDLRPADAFPRDDLGHGYDNMAEVLTVAPLLVEKYDQAAANLAEAALQPGSSARAQLVTCDPGAIGAGACGRQVLERFVPRAWRRPVAEQELAQLLGFFQLAQSEGEDFDAGLRLAVHATLMSPHFLFRVEKAPAAGEVRKLDGYELASRLSYFLWSTMPDDELFFAAESGKLDSDEGLEEQVDRMLADPRAEAVVDNFGGQWLTTRALSSATPDPQLFPDWDEELQAAMQRETALVMGEILAENRSLLDLLDAEFTWVNGRLAEHYGIAGVSGDDFQRITAPAERGGVLGHGAFLTLTSNPTRTSPVKRGKWVLAQLLCEEPPPPPPGVEGLPDGEKPTGSVREQMEMHRSDPVCAACHQLMDPIGFGLENFGPTGVFRTVDEAGFEIDPRGELPDGRIFEGAVELAQTLRDDAKLSGCMAQHAMIYALGRPLTRADSCAVEEVSARFEKGGNTFQALAKAIVTSKAFRMRAAAQEESK
ncbi:DUF1592 domain-containing protein [Vulgatibacter sp.]|uniref:DUF1592 domain-containing protein n=1 Tax=Vulgatibacter sp. TaxID=1971226 RepID=UPI0035622D19